MKDVMVGVDVGGTFTDSVLFDPSTARLITCKAPTTSPDPTEGILASVREVCEKANVSLSDVGAFLHGTTIATNALLEHRGVVVGLITTEGFRDILHIGRHQRPQNYSIMQDIPWQTQSLVERSFREVVAERIDGRGAVLVPLDEAGVVKAANRLVEAGAQSLVVAFINSYRNPLHENEAKRIIQDAHPEMFVTTSSEVAAQFREFERFTTAAINAFVGPVVSKYVDRVSESLESEGLQSPMNVMMSNGGVSTVADAARLPVSLLMSGPAAGVLGGRWAGEASGALKAITFDMGGTSADIGIVTAEGIDEASARDSWVAGYPVLAPMLDLLTVGAGGGSVAYLDAGGALRVGPRSAGATPGPACYSKGGVEPTVTDAHAVLGRLDASKRLGGKLTVDVEAARVAVGRIAHNLNLSIEEMADGILRISNNSMAAAIRSRTVQRGIDPREFALVAFGGAGPLHAAELAESLGIARVVIPLAPGNTSAFGLITTSLSYSAVETVFESTETVDPNDLNETLRRQRSQLVGKLSDAGVPDSLASIAYSADCRYIGQGYELKVRIPQLPVTAERVETLAETFHLAHKREYGHNFPGDPVEIVNLRTNASAPAHEITVQGHEAPVADGTQAPPRAGQAWFRTDDGMESTQIYYYDRSHLQAGDKISGPAVVYQDDATTVIPPGWVCIPDEGGNLCLECG